MNPPGVVLLAYQTLTSLRVGKVSSLSSSSLAVACHGIRTLTFDNPKVRLKWSSVGALQLICWISFCPKVKGLSPRGQKACEQVRPVHSVKAKAQGGLAMRLPPLGKWRFLAWIFPDV